MSNVSPKISTRNSPPLKESERKFVSYGKVGVAVLFAVLFLFSGAVAAEDFGSPEKYIPLGDDGKFFIVPADFTMSKGTTASVFAYTSDSGWISANWEVSEGNSVSITQENSNSNLEISATGNPGITTIVCSLSDDPSVSGIFNVTVVEENTLTNEVSINAGSRHSPHPNSWSETSSSSLQLTVHAASARAEANVADEFGHLFENKEIHWVNGAESVVEIAPYNDASNPAEAILITPKSTGTAVIYAYDKEAYEQDAETTAFTTLNVEVTEENTVKLETSYPSQLSDEALIGNYGFGAHAVDSFGNWIPDVAVTWEIEDSNVINLNVYEWEEDEGSAYTFHFSSPEIGTTNLKGIVTDTRFTGFTESYPIVVTAIDTSNLKISWDTNHIHGNTITTESACIIWAHICDQYWHLTDREISWSSSDNLKLTDYNSEHPENNRKEITCLNANSPTASITVSDKRSGHSETLTYNVAESEFSSVYLAINHERISKGGYTQADAAALDQYGNRLRYPITWSVSNTECVGISWSEKYNSFGYITALKTTGNTPVIITASATDGVTTKTWSKELYVEETVVTSIDIEDSYTCAKGSSDSVYVAVRDQNGSPTYDESIVLQVSTDRPDIIDISSTTVRAGDSIWFKALSTGEAMITVSYQGLSKSSKVTVVEPVVTEIQFDNWEIALGSEWGFGASVLDQFGNLIDTENLNLVWTIVEGAEYIELTEDENSGEECISVTAKAEGVATITISCNGITSEEYTITVYKPIVTQILYEEKDSLVIKTNRNQWIYVDVIDQNERHIDNPELTWTVDNPGVLGFIDDESTSPLSTITTNDNSVTIIGLSAGEATITVSSGGIEETIPVTVYAPEITTVNIQQQASFFAVGEPHVLSVEVLDQHGIGCKPFSLSISENDMFDAEYSEKEQTITVTPKSAGNTKLAFTITYNGKDTSKEIDITILEKAPITITSKGDFLVAGEVTLSGTNTESDSVYLYVEKPNLPENAATIRVPMQKIPIGEDSTLGPISVNEDDTWSVTFTPWHLDSGKYIIRAVPYAYNECEDGTVDKTNGAYDTTAYSEHLITLSNPKVTFAYFEYDGNKQEFILKGTATGTTELQYYVFDEKSLEYGKISVGTDETFGLNLPWSEVAGNVGYAIVQHPMYDKQFNVQIDEDNNVILYVTGADGQLIPYESTPLMKYGADAEKAILKMLGSFSIDDTSSSWETHLPPDIPVVSTLPLPTITPAGGTYASLPEVTITSDVQDGVIYYSLNDGDVLTYQNPIVLDETTTTITIAAFVIGQDGSSSEVATAKFIMDNPEIDHRITIANPRKGGTASVNGGNTAKSNELVTLTYTEETGYVFAGWSIQNEDKSRVEEKSNSVTQFAMWSEDVIIVPKFTLDTTPKPTTVTITNTPANVYVGDSGTLNARTYSQFGKLYSDNKVTWMSTNPDVIQIDANTGTYEALTTGQAEIVATSTEDSSVMGKLYLAVYNPPAPYISSAVVPETAEYGVMSDFFKIYSENTNYLNWNWGDGTSSRMQTSHSVSSYDTVSHAFVPTTVGQITVELTPSNEYCAAGEKKLFNLNVVYPTPSNLKITSGPTSVIAGEKVTYTAFATGADYFTWYLDGQEIQGQKGSAVSVTFPEKESAVLSVTATKNGGGTSDAVTKTVQISVRGGALGSFGALTTNPEYPAVNEAFTLTMQPVKNAVRYVWSFADGTTQETTAPVAHYTAKNTGSLKIKVTAFNSAGTSAAHEYSVTVGKAPSFTITSAKEGEPGATTYTVSTTDSVTKWVWYIGDESFSSTEKSYTHTWTIDDYGTHIITVTAFNNYGKTTQSFVYTVKPKEGVAPVIDKITGIHDMSYTSAKTLNVKFTGSGSESDYYITWYLDGKVILEGKGKKQCKLGEIAVGTHTVKVEVTNTQYEVSDSLEVEITVKAKGNKNSMPGDVDKAAPVNQQNLRLEDAASDKTALHLVDSLAVDSSDIQDDADEVKITLSPLSTDEISGFTEEMGDKENVLLSLSINPTGLTNEKDLNKGALITFRIPKSDVGDNHELVQFFRLDTKEAIQKWVVLSKVDTKEEGDFYVFTVKTSGMSDFVATFADITVEKTPTSLPPTPVTPSDGPSKDTGSGNYNEYPRTVTDGGEVSFGTAKIVKSVDLPKGLSGEVKLIAKSETPGPEGKETYNVFEINIPNYPKGEKAVIRFTISAAELEAKGFGPADIRLYHYDEENGWTPLSTSYKVTNDGVSYESETDSFSPFAIVFEKGAATERVDAEAPEDIPGVTPGDDEPLPSIPDTPTETPQTPSPVFGVIAGLLGAGLLLRRK